MALDASKFKETELSNFESNAEDIIWLSAHRGVTDGNVELENSREAIMAAERLWPICSMVEIDVRESVDGVQYLNHDETVTNARGFEMPVRGLTYKEVVDHSATEVLTLNDTLEIVKPGNLHVHFDLKSDLNVQLLVELIDAKIGLSRAIFAGDISSVLESVHNTLGAMGTRELTRIGFTTVDWKGDFCTNESNRESDFYDFICVPVDQLDDALVTYANSKGFEVVVWRKRSDEPLEELPYFGQAVTKLEELKMSLLLVTDEVLEDEYSITS